MLRIEDLTCRYGAIQATTELSLEVGEGQIVTIIGANGAGKSSTLGAISGLVEHSGTITFEGKRLSRAPDKVVARGIIQVPEGRAIFPNLTVEENLLAGAYARRDRAAIKADLEQEYARFPTLADRRKDAAANLSGGQQQMMVLARGMMARPRLLMLDEPSLGLAPVLVRQIMESILQINRERGMTVLLVEQSVKLALEVAEYGYVLERGRVALHGPTSELRRDDGIRRAYLGGAPGTRATASD